MSLINKQHYTCAQYIFHHWQVSLTNTMMLVLVNEYKMIIYLQTIILPQKQLYLSQQ